ncbi:sodium:proline symporter [Pseudomonas sp. PA15(2017)]|uniref:PepSY domain-containing protein n=1 Tax=Pseudomonas sp. PA15(2017) TaxID=1932111 RepID=UPI000969BDEB|nr:PepSY domain-containing protein [Pseudomonas sp. PA15(2017)]OLU23249.1 sodium:proline symporter [Pseudomonas sp. PA15(2017)]
MKRYLYLWHRWLGIGLCLFMATWFFSGVVMLFVGYPKLTPAEHFAHLPALATNDCCIGPGKAIEAAGPMPSAVRLTTVAGQPRYILDYSSNVRVAIDARSGLRIDKVDKEAALASAAQFAQLPSDYRGTVQEDAWTRSRGLDRDRPLHVVQLEEPEARLLYISGQTGAVVRDANHTERVWNWVGSWLHWLYPFRDSPWWAQIVIYLSLTATLMALLGQVVGIMRWRFSKPYRSGSRSPYQSFSSRWHHIGGLLFGTLAIAWIFSGLMSMRPWGIFDSPNRLDVSSYRAPNFDSETDADPITETVARFQASGFEPVELHWQFIGGTRYRVAYDRAGESRILPESMEAQVIKQLPSITLERAARTIRPQDVLEVQWLDTYDFYYFSRSEQSMYGAYRKRLPMLRVRFQDPAATWLHLDPYTGAVIEQLDRRQRTERWLFNLLHSWDWLPLLERPWLREGLIVLFSLGGLLISLTGIVLAWRRLRPRRKSVITNAETARAATVDQGQQ